MGKYCTFDLLRQICPLILMMKIFEEMDLIGNLNQDKPLKSGCFRLTKAVGLLQATTKAVGLDVNVQRDI